MRSRAAVRRLVRGDLNAVIRIDAVHTGTPQPAYWKRTFREALQASPDRVVGLGAELDGRLVGFLFGAVRAFEFGSEACGWILEVGVDPRHARRGIASALLGEARRRFRARGISTIRTMVRRNDIPLLTFFRTSGFVGGPYVQLELVDASPERRGASRPEKRP